MTLLDEALSLLKELRPHAPIERAWLTDPNAMFDRDAWFNSPVETSSKLRDKIDDLLTRATLETKTEQVKPECAHCDHSYIDHVDDGMPGECIIMGCLCDEYAETALNTSANTGEEP